ncbi:hypothetical protein ACP70R_046959 [Stipagrostis hirtigluma subsp. patula]
MDGEEENVGPFRRTSARTRRMASRMASALASSDNRAQAALARLEALESDNAGVEAVDLNDEEYGSTDEEDPGYSHAKEAVQDYETQDKARESFGEEGGKIIHGCVTRSKFGVPASSCPNIFEGCCGPTEHIIPTPLLLSLWKFC